MAERDFSAKLAGKFVDDDDLVRTGRAWVEIDGYDFLHIPVPTGFDETLNTIEAQSAQVAKDAAAAGKYASAAKSSASAAAASAKKVAGSESTAARYANEAKSSADLAETAAGNAKQSESSAASSARAAKSDANLAAESQYKTAVSYQDAKNSAAAAAESASQAAGSAKTATTSAETATSKAGEATTQAASAANSAGAAKTSETNALSSANAAKSSASSAATSETNAASSASAAKSSASSASSSASKAATSEKNAGESSAAAANSAGSAKSDADRAANIANSTKWDGDKLTVNGKTSPSLTGPKGDPGQDGKDGASTWADIKGVPSEFPPRSHRHASGDIVDAVNDAGDPKFGGKVIKGRERDGKIFYYSAPTEGKELANKSYVDSTAKAAQSLAVTEAIVNITRQVNTISGEGWEAICIGRVVQLVFNDWNGADIPLPFNFMPGTDTRGVGYDMGTKTAVPIYIPAWGNVTAVSPDASRIFGQVVYLLRRE